MRRLSSPSIQRDMTLAQLVSLRATSDSIDSVTTSGQYTVVIHLKLPVSRRSRRSSPRGTEGSCRPDGAHPAEGANFGANPICVGPFMFDHRVVGDNITLIKSPYYYDQKDIFLDKIVFKPETDAAAAVAALEAGDIQALDSISTTDLPGLQQSPDVRVIQANGLGFSGIYVNIGNETGIGNLPYTNVGSPLASSAKLRQAFEEAIDRNTMNRVVFGGLVQPSCTPVSPANSVWFDASIRCTPYNPKDARKLRRRRQELPGPTVHLTRRTGPTHPPPGAVHPGRGGGGRDQRRGRLDRHRDGSDARGQRELRHVPEHLDRQRRSRLQHLPVPRDPQDRQNRSGYSNPRSTDCSTTHARRSRQRRGRRSTTSPNRSSRPTGRSSTSTTASDRHAVATNWKGRVFPTSSSASPTRSSPGHGRPVPDGSPRDDERRPCDADGADEQRRLDPDYDRRPASASPIGKSASDPSQS